MNEFNLSEEPYFIARGADLEGKKPTQTRVKNVNLSTFDYDMRRRTFATPELTLDAL